MLFNASDNTETNDIKAQQNTFKFDYIDNFDVLDNQDFADVQIKGINLQGSPKSNDNKLGDTQVRNNNKAEHSSNSSTDKSTSVSSSVINTPAPIQAKCGSDQGDQQSNITNQALAIRVVQSQEQTGQNEQQNVYGQQTIVKRGRKQTAQQQTIGKYQKETEIRAKQGSVYRQGRWTKEEHYRFLEALKLYGKEWRKVQLHVRTRTSTQARSHAQKFFVKIEKKNLSLEEFLKDLDLNNLEQDMMFSDLDDDEPSEEHKAISVDEDLNEESQSKSQKMQRKKSVMSYGIQQLEEVESQQLNSPSKSAAGQIRYQSSEALEKSPTSKHDSKAENASPTRPIHMRQSKINHSILQKRYREDESGTRKESVEVQPQVTDQLLPNPDQLEQGFIEKKSNKRRVVNPTKKNTFAEPAVQDLSQTVHYNQGLLQPPTLQKQQTVIPLTPNLKHSDPVNIRMYDDKHVYKRSNSQNEFELFQNIGTHHYLDFNDPSPLLNNGYQPSMDNFFHLNPHDQVMASVQAPSMEKSYSTPFPFSVLAAPGVPAPIGLNQQNGCTYRNSFDFLEMESSNLLEMTGDNYQRLLNQGTTIYDSLNPSNYLQKPQVPPFTSNPNQQH